MRAEGGDRLNGYDEAGFWINFFVVDTVINCEHCDDVVSIKRQVSHATALL
jgi:hypothetical protein